MSIATPTRPIQVVESKQTTEPKQGLLKRFFRLLHNEEATYSDEHYYHLNTHWQAMDENQ